MKLSILILTHNRPLLFERCLKSVLHNMPCGVELLINNDSNDIVEYKHDHIHYFYEQSENISELYKFIFDKSSAEYVYFLEDDDYLEEYFWGLLKTLTHDLYYMNFKPVEDAIIPIHKFEIEKKNDLFQLSQILFKKKLCTEFPDGNHLDNDWKMFQNILSNTDDIKLIKVPMFVQTTDGKDNISFKEFNNDKRFDS